MNDTSTRGTNENMNGTSIKGTDLRPHLRKGPHARMGPAENGAPTDRKYQEALVTNGSVYPPLKGNHRSCHKQRARANFKKIFIYMKYNEGP